jgi:thiol-disulfide isomerase/thioredoxin
MNLAWLLVAVAGSLNGQPVCEPAEEIGAILREADRPHDLRRSLDEHRAAVHAVLERGFRTHADDPFLHAARLEFDLGRSEENRPALALEAEKRLAQAPDNPHRLYLAALANYSLRTPRALELIAKLRGIRADYGPALLLEARIRSSKQFRSVDGVKAALAAYNKVCPRGIGAFVELAAIEDVEFLKTQAATLRLRLANRSDLLAVHAYPALWQWERAAYRSDEMVGVTKRWMADVAHLRKPAMPRGVSWMNALWGASFLMELPMEQLAPGYVEDFAGHYPHAWPSQMTVIDQLRGLGPTLEAFEKWRALSDRYPASTGIVSYWMSVARGSEDDGTALVDAYQAMKSAMELSPDSFLTSPPFQITMAEELVKRGIRFDLVPSFVIAGIAAGERAAGRDTVTDLYPNAAAIRQKQHDAWYLFGYYPLIEAYAVQEKYAEARDILSQAHRILERMRPERSAAPEEKARFAMFEAGYWRAKGILSERQGKKFDALIAYRNALASYGPRSARGDARDAVYASAQRLAKELGSSAEGWTDWEAKQPLPNLRSGHGGSNAWLQLDARHPRLQVTDMQGRTYTPEQLAKTKTFVNVWATWCLPCRAELPYLEKLAARYKDRRDVVFVALNVDDEESLVTPFLERYRFTFRTAMARSYAYDFLPVFGVPANYIIGDKTVYFEGKGKEDEWVESAEAALREKQ